LARTIENRDQQHIVHRPVAVDVLDFDSCIINQHSNREGDFAQRHGVDGLTSQLEPNDRGQY
jgi:hypothetical protein